MHSRTVDVYFFWGTSGELAGHTRAECALHDHVTFKRWLRQTSTGRLVTDKAAIAAEEKQAASTCSQRPTST